MSGRAYSAIILAGGDGTRLIPLTRALTGVDWNDLGDPGRVVIARQRLDRQIALA